MSRETALARVQRTAAEQAVPFSVLFELTERCNYACPHCYLEHDPRRELSTAECLDVLDQLASLFEGGRYEV